MSLTHSSPIAFIPTRSAEASRRFYEQTLGLTFLEDNDFAMVFSVGPEPGSMLRVVRAAEFTPAAYTVFGWAVPDVAQTVDALAAKGVAFLRYGHFKQDERGVWNAPDGTRVAWFQDPDGNTLSVSQFLDGQGRV